MSDKISAQHLRRKAILYVRQSTAHQLTHNQESRRLQYAMQDRLRVLGWQEIEVIDDDLGRSASGAQQRPGFERLVAEVGLGRVGAVAARELSRFARNSRDWQQLIEVSRYVDTLLVDEDSIYDARQGNDRLLLGVKGSLNEYELDLLRLRSQEARREKTRRGEYYARIPVGFRKGDDGTLELHPDRRIREVLRLIFGKALELGSVRQLLLWLREQGIEVPRDFSHTVIWKPASYTHLISILKNPVYAGYYVYGKTKTECTLENGQFKRRVVRVPQADWKLIADHHEAYITPAEYDRFQDMITRNAQTRYAAHPGAPKKGSALLVGLLRCIRCGRKLMVRYSGEQGNIARYDCSRGNETDGQPRCISFSSIDVDDRMAAEILDVVRPAAVAAALVAARECEQEVDQLVQTLRTELEAARYAADRAWKQYDSTDPENRLVADELERRWNQALGRVEQIEHRLEQQTDTSSRAPDHDDFTSLASNLDEVWTAPTTDARMRKRIARTLIEEIVADVDQDTREVVLVVHWKGGVHTNLRVQKRRHGVSRVRTPDDVVAAIRTMALVCDDSGIAAWLTRAGMRTARGNRWTRELVASLRQRQEIPQHDPKRQAAEGWLTKKDAAALLGVADKTIERAVERGELSALRPLGRGLWILNESELRRPEVVARFQQRRPRRRQGAGVPAQAELNINIPTR